MKIEKTLLALGWLALAGFVAAGVERHVAPGEIQRHVMASLLASLLLLFAHCWIAIFLVDTGRALRDVVRERSLDPELPDRARLRRRRTLAWVLAASALVVASFVLGGAGFAGSVGIPVHVGVAVAALLVEGATLVVAGRALGWNHRLFTAIDRATGAP